MATTAVLQQPSAAAAAGAASPHPTAGTSSSHGTGRRMSRPPAAAVAPTDGWEDDVVPTLRRRAYLVPSFSRSGGLSLGRRARVMVMGGWRR